MRKIIKIILCIPIVILILPKSINAEDITISEKEFVEMGIPAEFSENIITYIKDMNLNKEIINEVIKENSVITKLLEDNYKAENITLNDIYEIHNEATDIMAKFKIDMEISIIENEVIVKDLIRNNILFKCNISEIDEYYNYFMFKGGKEAFKKVFIELKEQKETVKTNSQYNKDNSIDYMQHNENNTNNKSIENGEDNNLYQNEDIDSTNVENIKLKSNMHTESIIKNNIFNNITKYLGGVVIVILIIALMKK